MELRTSVEQLLRQAGVPPEGRFGTPGRGGCLGGDRGAPKVAACLDLPTGFLAPAADCELAPPAEWPPLADQYLERLRVRRALAGTSAGSTSSSSTLGFAAHGAGAGLQQQRLPRTSTGSQAHSMVSAAATEPSEASPIYLQSHQELHEAASLRASLASLAAPPRPHLVVPQNLFPSDEDGMLQQEGAYRHGMHRHQQPLLPAAAVPRKGAGAAGVKKTSSTPRLTSPPRTYAAGFGRSSPRGLMESPRELRYQGGVGRHSSPSIRHSPRGQQQAAAPSRSGSAGRITSPRRQQYSLLQGSASSGLVESSGPQLLPDRHFGSASRLRSGSASRLQHLWYESSQPDGQYGGSLQIGGSSGSRAPQRHGAAAAAAASSSWYLNGLHGLADEDRSAPPPLRESIAASAQALNLGQRFGAEAAAAEERAEDLQQELQRQALRHGWAWPSAATSSEASAAGDRPSLRHEDDERPSSGSMATPQEALATGAAIGVNKASALSGSPPAYPLSPAASTPDLQAAPSRASPPLPPCAAAAAAAVAAVDISDLLDSSLASFVASNAGRGRQLAAVVESGEAARVAASIFQSFEPAAAAAGAAAGCLPWVGCVLRNYVTAVCQQLGLVPPDEFQLYQVYTRFDAERAMLLRQGECLQLMEALCLAAAGLLMRRAEPPTNADAVPQGLQGIARGGSSTARSRSSSKSLPDNHPTAQAERWLETYRPPTVRTGSSQVSYPGGLFVDLQELLPWLAPVASANAVHQMRMAQLLESGELIHSALTVFMEVDRAQHGSLAWAGGEVQGFVATIFEHYGLSPPTEGQLYPLLKRFGAGGGGPRLEATRCICLVDAACRAVFYSAVASLQVRNVPATSSAAPSAQEAAAASADGTASPPPPPELAHVSDDARWAAEEPPADTAISAGAAAAAGLEATGQSRSIPAADDGAATAGAERPPELAPTASFDRPPPAPRCNVYAVPEADSLEKKAPVEKKAPAQHPTELAGRWVCKYKALPISGTVSITYSSGVVVDFADFAERLYPMAVANAGRRQAMLNAIESGETMRTALEVFRAVDDSGFLSWPHGLVLFVEKYFEAYRLRPPSQRELLGLYLKFDNGRNSMLNTSESLCLVDALLRAVFHLEVVASPPPLRQEGAEQAAARLPQSDPGKASAEKNWEPNTLTRGGRPTSEGGGLAQFLLPPRGASGGAGMAGMQHSEQGGDPPPRSRSPLAGADRGAASNLGEKPRSSPPASDEPRRSVDVVLADLGSTAEELRSQRERLRREHEEEQAATMARLAECRARAQRLSAFSAAGGTAEPPAAGDTEERQSVAGFAVPRPSVGLREKRLHSPSRFAAGTPLGGTGGSSPSKARAESNGRQDDDAPPEQQPDSRSKVTVNIHNDGDDVRVLRDVFRSCDISGDGRVNKREFVRALRRQSGTAAAFFKLPGNIRQADGSHEKFEALFQRIDGDGDREITWEEFRAFYEREAEWHKDANEVLSKADQAQKMPGATSSPEVAPKQKRVTYAVPGSEVSSDGGDGGAIVNTRASLRSLVDSDGASTPGTAPRSKAALELEEKLEKRRSLIEAAEREGEPQHEPEPHAMLTDIDRGIEACSESGASRPSPVSRSSTVRSAELFDDPAFSLLASEPLSGAGGGMASYVSSPVSAPWRDREDSSFSGSPTPSAQAPGGASRASVSFFLHQLREQPGVVDAQRWQEMEAAAGDGRRTSNASTVEVTLINSDDGGAAGDIISRSGFSSDAGTTTPASRPGYVTPPEGEVWHNGSYMPENWKPPVNITR
eukprot:TRINITY_DN22693_c1_g1_i1.p1 TRINITY_DN22693_c1_g1~~TRINITY_DN22693_c1_g1_i1.p1  ORF type:complete len:1778 (-),score=425.59 TRINITY_DN22693_c1_g1_i1:59-5392(-)